MTTIQLRRLLQPVVMPTAVLAQVFAELDRIDERSDVFGLGAILCEVLTGKPPYVGGNRGELHARAATGDLADALGLTPVERAALIRAAAAARRRARWQKAGS